MQYAPFNDPSLGAAAANIGTMLFGNPQIAAQAATDRARRNLIVSERMRSDAQRQELLQRIETAKAEQAIKDSEAAALGALPGQITAALNDPAQMNAALGGLARFGNNYANVGENLYRMINAADGTAGAFRNIAFSGDTVPIGNAVGTQENYDGVMRRMFQQELEVQDRVNQGNTVTTMLDNAAKKEIEQMRLQAAADKAKENPSIADMQAGWVKNFTEGMSDLDAYNASRIPTFTTPGATTMGVGADGKPVPLHYNPQLPPDPRELSVMRAAAVKGMGMSVFNLLGGRVDPNDPTSRYKYIFDEDDLAPFGVSHAELINKIGKLAVDAFIAQKFDSEDEAFQAATDAILGQNNTRRVNLDAGMEGLFSVWGDGDEGGGEKYRTKIIDPTKVNLDATLDDIVPQATTRSPVGTMFDLSDPAPSQLPAKPKNQDNDPFGVR